MATLYLSGGSRHKVCGPCLSDAQRGHQEATDDVLALILPWEDDRYSGGVYAGVYCDRHWRQSGYRDDMPNVVGGMTEDEIEALDYTRED